MRKLSLLIVFCFALCNGYAQSNAIKGHQLIVTLKNAPFSSLALLAYSDHRNVIIKGKDIGRSKWQFTVPDSMVANSSHLVLIVPDKDTVANGYRQVRFNREFENKKNSFANIGIQDAVNHIEATYQGHTLYERENIAQFLGLADSVVVGNLIADDFKLSIKDDEADITIRSLEPNYCWFLSSNGNSAYDDQLQAYIALAKKYPRSRYLLTYLALNLNQFKTRQDVKSIYQNLAKQPLNSKWSNRIERFLSDDFRNINLVNLESKSTEAIFQTSSKYSLVTFSASWCVPCIEEIPLLKKLYQDLKEQVDFTYVSIDNENGVKAFQDLLVKHDVRWRTLYAYQALDRVQDLLAISSIPHSLLVHPDGHVEVVAIRDQEVQKKLYAQVGLLMVK